MSESSTSRKDDFLSKVTAAISGCQHGYTLTEGIHPDAAEHFTVIKRRGEPRLLLPASRQLMQTALAGFLGGNRVAAYLPVFIEGAARIGGPFSRCSANVSLLSSTGDVTPLRDLIAGVLGRNDFQLAFRLSFGRPNGKTVAMAISDAGEALCYVKLASEKIVSGLVEHEGTVLEQLKQSELPLIVPSCLYSGPWADEYNVLITGPLKLEPLKRDAHKAHIAAAQLATINAKQSGVLSDSDYWQQTLHTVQSLDNHQDLLVMVRDIQRIWGEQEFQYGTSHGDWTRANVGLVDGRLAAFDWERCSPSAPRGIDMAHFTIFELSTGRFSRSIKLDDVISRFQECLNVVEIDSGQAQPLVAFALLEMVIRFKIAENAGIKSADRKFGSALQESLRKWSV